MKQKIILLLFIVLCVSCSNNKNENGPEKTIKVNLANAYSNTQNQEVEVIPSEEKLTTLAFYLCDGGKVTNIFKGLNTDLKTIEISSAHFTSSSVIYAIVNEEVVEGVNEIVTGSPEEDLKGLKTAQSADKGQVVSLAMAGYTPIANGDKSLKMQLKRNMARFDLENKSGVKIHSIQIEGLSTGNPVFDFEVEPVPTDLSALVRREFQTPLTASFKRLFYCHPSPMGGIATIDASYNGVRRNVRTEVAAIQRNCIQTIHLRVSSGSLTANITSSNSDIENGDDVEADRVTTVIDQVKSVISNGVAVSDAGQRITFPALGGEAKLFLSGNAGEVLKNGGEQSEISGFELITNAQESSYTIKIGAQTRQGGGNQVAVLSFGLPEQTDPSQWSHIAVVVMNYAPFSIVTFGDLDWMITNGFSRNLADYPTLRDGNGFRNLYSFWEDWEKYSGKGHQWGPRAGTESVAAWERRDVKDFDHNTSPAINGPILDNATSWTGATVPCPSGWRLPTHDEFNRIWPTDGTAITTNNWVSYTTSYGNFTATIEEFGGLHKDHTTTQQDLRIRIARNLIIKQEDKELCFPIAGNRVATGIVNMNQWSGYGWGVGVEVQYWCQDKVNGKYVTVGINNGVIRNNTNSVPHNDWINVRCVRDVLNK